MNTSFRTNGRGGSGLARGVSLVLGALMAIAGMLLLWVTLFVGAVAFFGWWGWQKLRGRQPGIDLAAAFAQRARAHTYAHAHAPGSRHLRQGEVVDVEVREVAPGHEARQTVDDRR